MGETCYYNNRSAAWREIKYTQTRLTGRDERAFVEEHEEGRLCSPEIAPISILRGSLSRFRPGIKTSENNAGGGENSEKLGSNAAKPGQIGRPLSRVVTVDDTASFFQIESTPPRLGAAPPELLR